MRPGGVPQTVAADTIQRQSDGSMLTVLAGTQMVRQPDGSMVDTSIARSKEKVARSFAAPLPKPLPTVSRARQPAIVVTSISARWQQQMKKQQAKQKRTKKASSSTLP